MSFDTEYERMRREYMQLRGRVIFRQDRAAEAASEDLARAMRELCTVSGSDLRELATFLRDADYDLIAHFSPT